MRKKHLLIAISAIMLAMLAACEGSTTGSGKLYIEVLPSGYELYCVKFLKVGEDAANGTNVFSKYVSTEKIGAYTYYLYKAPKKEFDLYTENYNVGGYQGRNNDRERVNLKVNDWVKMTSEHGSYAVTGDWVRSDGVGDVY